MKFLINNYLQSYNCGAPLQEIVALCFGLRRLIRIGVFSRQLKVLKEICQKLGLKLLTIESYDSNRNNLLLLISKSEKRLKEFYKLEKKYIKKYFEPSIIGKYLGYPVCCIKEYKKNFKFKNRNNPIKTLLNTKGKLNFRLNYLYNFQSRQFNYQKFNRISPNYHLFDMYLIPHIPCSFNCKQSIGYAQNLLNILKLYFPIYYKKMIFFLKRPILYFNDFVFFPILGKANNNLLKYQGFIKIHDNLPIKMVNLLDKGNLFKFKKESNIKVYKDKYLLSKLPSGVKLFNFK